MSSPGIVILRNPGPDTTLEVQGCGGFHDPDFETYTQAAAAVAAAKAEGHHAYVLVAFDSEEGDGYTQVEIGYDLDDAARNGLLNDEELAAYEQQETP